jgi:LPS-assembly protein
VFPVKLKRQTGLLAPEFGLSDRKGFEYLQPFYWAINESSDATIYNRYIEKRGDMLGVEYRYMLSDVSKGFIFYDRMNDKEIDDGTTESTEKWGYEDSVDRQNHKRYWLRMKQDQTLPGGVFLKSDIDVVSDQDYLREFSDMKNGYDASKSYFLENFGRDIEAEDDYIRTNSLILTKNWSTYSLNTSTTWYDNVVRRTKGLTDPTLQRLPTIDFTSARRQLFGSPFYYDFDTEYDYFFRKDTTDTNRNGQRADLYPRLILPLRFKNWLSVESIVGARNTTWYLDKDTNVSDKLDGTHNRQIYDLSFDFSTNLYRLFNTGFQGVDKIRHAITPKLTYNYTPEKDQTEYPFFDSLDRIKPVSTLTFSLTNTLTSRSRAIDKPAEEEKKDAAPILKKFDYRQFCRFKLEQVYDFNEANETNPDDFINGETREPFRPLYGEIEFLPADYISFDADGKWSHNDHHLDRKSTRLNSSHNSESRMPSSA